MAGVAGQSVVRVTDLPPAHQTLVEAARAARERAYAPQSRFRVGAAVLTADGETYSGCNVENRAFTLCMCAERVALFSAVAHGDRRFVAIAIVADSSDPAPPCGACRQVIAELAPEATVTMATASGDALVMSSRELLP